MKQMVRGTVKLAYREVGTEHAPAMLFVHGWGCDHSHFAAQQAFFGNTRRTVAVDLRGHGASDAPVEDYTVASFVDDLAWQCRELELNKPIVVGHSMGGNIALEFASRHPDLLAAVVVIDSVLFPSADIADGIRAMAEGLRSPDYLSVLAQSAVPLFLPTDDPAVRSRFAASVKATPQHVLASSFSSHLVDYDAAGAASNCRLPVAYIGAETPLGNTSKFGELSPQLKVGRVLGAGHFVTILVPDQVNAMITAFDQAYVRSASYSS
jgi:pimeloyl-ACP methyl ester carboxylesterase